jgi:hypothetical protein
VSRSWSALTSAEAAFMGGGGHTAWLTGIQSPPKNCLISGVLRRRMNMSDPYLSYLANITAKTGKTPEEIAAMLKTDGVLKKGVKAGEIVAWLKEKLDLGHGHAMAIVKWLKEHDEM